MNEAHANPRSFNDILPAEELQLLINLQQSSEDLQFKILFKDREETGRERLKTSDIQKKSF